jgi:hypothetical protein
VRCSGTADAPRSVVRPAAALFLLRAVEARAADLHDIVVILAPTRASSINPHAYLLPLWGLSVVGVTLACARSRRDFAPITAVLNVVAVALVVPPLVSAGAYAAARHRNRTTASVPPQSPVKVLSVATAPVIPATPAAPDIYYIVLDAYGRQDRLREFFGYDNEPFLRELEKRGFFVARKARSNYVQTVLSLGSSLNMTYLDEVTRGAAGTPMTWIQSAECSTGARSPHF